MNHTPINGTEKGWIKAGCRPLNGGQSQSATETVNVDEQDPWPDPIDQAAYHGLAGEIVGLIEPHSEADPIALLAAVSRRLWEPDRANRALYRRGGCPLLQSLHRADRHYRESSQGYLVGTDGPCTRLCRPQMVRKSHNGRPVQRRGPYLGRA